MPGCGWVWRRFGILSAPESWRSSDTIQWIKQSNRVLSLTLYKYRINFNVLRMSISLNMRWPKDGPRTVIFSASGVVNFGHFAHFALSKSAMIYGVHLTLFQRLSPSPATNLSAAEFTQKEVE